MNTFCSMLICWLDEKLDFFTSVASDRLTMLQWHSEVCGKHKLENMKLWSGSEGVGWVRRCGVGQKFKADLVKCKERIRVNIIKMHCRKFWNNQKKFFKSRHYFVLCRDNCVLHPLILIYEELLHVLIWLSMILCSDLKLQGWEVAHFRSV